LERTLRLTLDHILGEDTDLYTIKGNAKRDRLIDQCNSALRKA
jgi:hypothetical protein